MIALLTQFCAGQVLAGYEYLESQSSKVDQMFPFAAEGLNVGSKIDLSCFIPASEAYAKWNSGWLLVDVRKQKKFNQFHVLNSINIPLYTVASRNFLKNKHVLLIGDGFHMGGVSTTCKNLKKKGFQSVLAVFGGTLAWSQFNFLFEGIVPQRLNQASLPVEYFDQMKNNSFWNLVNLEPDHQAEWEMLLPNVKIAGQKVVEKHEKKAGLNGLDVTLFINNNGKYNQGVLRGFEKKQSLVLVLEGGMKAYKAYLRKQQMMKAYALRPPKKFKTCGY